LEVFGRQQVVSFACCGKGRNYWREVIFGAGWVEIGASAEFGIRSAEFEQGEHRGHGEERSRTKDEVRRTKDEGRNTKEWARGGSPVLYISTLAQIDPFVKGSKRASMAERAARV
jgi:hypothetical protein